MEIVEEETEILNGVREIIRSREGVFQNVIVLLQDVQNRFRYIPKTAMFEIANHLGISPTNVYGVATFYNRFRFYPPGKYHLKVCMGTACHIKGGDKVLDQWKRRLEIDEDQRTPDGEFSLQRVACVGCCSMAPVTIINDDVIGYMSPNTVDGILLKHAIGKERAGVSSRKADPSGENETAGGEGPKARP